MDELKKIEDFFKYDLLIKKDLYEFYPNESFSYNRETAMRYGDYLYELVKNMRFYLNKICECLNLDDAYKEFHESLLKEIEENISSNYDNYYGLKQVYINYFADMSEQFVNKCGINHVGYKIFKDNVVFDARTINELLHAYHTNLVNNEYTFEKLPILEEKKNSRNVVKLYGCESDIAKLLCDCIPSELSSYQIDIMSLDKGNKIILMARDLGHALTMEISIDGNKAFVNYNIPKICNVDMVNALKGVRPVDENSMYTVGSFECSVLSLVYELVEFMEMVPTDSDMVNSYYSKMAM